MWKKLLFIALLAIPATASAQLDEYMMQQAHEATPRFGYLSYQEVFKAMPEYADAQEQLNLLKAKYEAEIKRAEKEFNRKYGEFLQEQKDFPETILIRRQKELQQLMEKSIEFKNEVNELLKKAQQEMTLPVTDKLRTVIQLIGEQHGFEYILNTDNNAYPYINTAYGLDITQEVKQRLGIKEEEITE